MNESAATPRRTSPPRCARERAMELAERLAAWRTGGGFFFVDSAEVALAPYTHANDPVKAAELVDTLNRRAAARTGTAARSLAGG